MNNMKFFSTDSQPNPDDMKVIVKGMLDYHASKGHPRKAETFSIVMKNGDEVVGGIIVGFLYQGMEVQTLWVHESFRGKDSGTKLLKMAEAEATKRGCTVAYTNTFTWQAPEFYKKNGYQIYGELKDFPKGNSLTYVFKKLK